jgi:hypothetical protein
MGRSAWVLAVVTVGGAVAWSFEGCSSSGSTPPAVDSGASDDSGAPDATTPDSGEGIDSGATDSAAPAVDASDASADAAVVTGMAIVTSNGVPLAAAPGSALPLEVVFTLSDGTTAPLPSSVAISWVSPATITAQDPLNPGPNSVLPDAGAQPTAFYIANPYRTDRTNYPGLLFVIGEGSVADAGVTVTAQFADGGAISAVVPVGPAPVGVASAGAALYSNTLYCYSCHGLTGGGSPSVLLPDGGQAYDDAGDPLYILSGGDNPFPAPGLNNTSPGGAPNLAADPAWNAALLGMSAAGDIDNFGVALRYPMPDWSTGIDTAGHPVTAQDWADMYAWLVTQTQ